MNLTRAAINRPIFVFMLVFAAFLLGWISYNGMRLELNPDVSFGSVTVTTAYPGASPDDVNQLISKRVEDAVSGVSGVREVTSTSMEGASIVVLSLELGTDLDAAVNDVRSKVDSITDALPKDALKPQVLKFDTTSSPIMTLSLSSTKLSSKELRDLIDDKIADQYAQIAGVVSVGVSGGDQREIQVRLSREKLMQYGLGVLDVQQALDNASLNVPAGHLVNGPQDYTVRVISQFTDPAQIRNMIVSINDPNNPNAKARTVHLGDIADVADSSVERTTYARLNGLDTIALVLQKAKNGNSVEIADAADQVTQKLTDQYKDDGLKITKTFVEATQIRDSLKDLIFALCFGVLLVATIVYVFLHNLRGTIIVAVAIPTCIFCAFIGMKLLGFTINSMTMLSLSLAIGVLVDDAIVVLENIYRHLKHGEDPRDAALNGRGEIGTAALAITMADVVVFLPIAFMGGIVGQFFKPLALGYVCAVLFSLFISFTLTPLLAARWYRAGEDMEHPTGAFASWFERRFSALEHHYRNTLEWALQHRWFVFLTGNLALVAVIQFIAGSFTPDTKTAVLYGLPVLAIAFVVSLFVFAVNFVRNLPPDIRGPLVKTLTRGIPVLLVLALLLPAPFRLLPLGLVGSIVALGIVGCLIANVIVPRSKMRYIASGLAFGLIFPIASMAGHAFAAYKQGAVFKFEFIPSTDAGTVKANIQLPAGSSLEATQNVVSLVEKKFMADPDMKYVLSTVGEEGAGGFNAASSGSNYAQVQGTLYDRRALTDSLPWAHHDEKLRTRSDNTIAGNLTKSVGRIPGAQISISTQGSGFGSAVQLSFTGDNHDLLLQTALKVRDALADGKIKGVINPQLSTNAGKPELQIRPNREELADAGLEPSTLGNAIGNLYQGNDNIKMRVNGREYGIRVMMDLKDRNNPEVMKSVPIKFSQGKPVFLGSVADVVQAPGIDKITRRDRAEEIVVTADTLGVANGTVNADIQKWLTSNNVIPAGVHFKPGGAADAQAREQGFILTALILGFVLVYMLLASLYDNLLYPFIIQVSQPQAMVGALLALIITDKSLNIIGIIGIIALIGLVSKNAILLVDYTNTLRDRGRSRHDALVESGPTRLRPIMMTTMALILGMLPVALAIGRGSEFRETIGISIIGGISLSTLLTLLVIPCSYTIFDDITIAFAKALHRKPQHMAADAASPDDSAGEPSESETMVH
ncbi:MAG TPA: efflux RND transporter permease subunit [Fimbriimonas sp.]|nr:efflux RND transporter permease subunit [Fimbriimonas sp.]